MRNLVKGENQVEYMLNVQLF